LNVKVLYLTVEKRQRPLKGRKKKSDHGHGNLISRDKKALRDAQSGGGGEKRAEQVREYLSGEGKPKEVLQHP